MHYSNKCIFSNFQSSLYVAIVVYAPMIALSSVTNMSWWVCVLLLGTCSTLYTTLGGIAAIVWCDVFQTIAVIPPNVV